MIFPFMKVECIFFEISFRFLTKIYPFSSFRFCMFLVKYIMWYLLFYKWDSFLLNFSTSYCWYSKFLLLWIALYFIFMGFQVHNCVLSTFLKICITFLILTILVSFYCHWQASISRTIYLSLVSIIFLLS